MSLISATRDSRATVLSFLVLGAGWGCIAALVPDLKAGLGVNDAVLGRLLLASAGGLITAMWVAPWFDRKLRAGALPVATLMLGVTFVLPGMAQGVMQFALAMAVVGITSGLTDVVMNVRVSEREVQTGRSLMNLNHAMFSFAYAAGALWTGGARELGLDPAWPLALVGVCALAVFPFCWQPVADVENPNSSANRSPIGRVVMWGGLIVLVAFLVENAVEIWSALHIERTLHGRAAEGALGPAILGLTMGVGRLSGQVIADRLREQQVIMVASFTAAVGVLVAAMATTTWVAYLGFGVAGLGVSVIAPMALALIGKMVPDAERARAISRAAVIGFSGFFIGPPILGAVSNAYGLRMAFIPCVVLLMAVPLLVAALSRAGQAEAGTEAKADPN